MTADAVVPRPLTRQVKATAIDQDTGAVLALEWSEPLKKRPGRHPRAIEPFCIVFPEGMARLISSDLTGGDLRVFWQLVAIMAFEQPFPYSTNAIAEATGIRKQNVSRSIGRLRRDGFIIDVDRHILLDPYIVWRGSLPSRMHWLARLEKPRTTTPEGTP